MVYKTKDHAPSLPTNLTRRDALHWLMGAVAASIAGTYRLRFRANREGLHPSGPKLRLDALRPLVGDSFLVGHGDDTLFLTLEQVCDLWSARSPTRAADARPGCFSLLFGGLADASLGQGTYRFDHRVLGTLWLFIVPMASDGRRQLYEAVINHRRPDEAASAPAQIP